MEQPERGWGERSQASQPGKKEHQVLAVGYESEMEGLAMREGDLRLSLYEPSWELQRKK